MFEASSQGKKESLLARYASNTIVEKMEKGGYLLLGRVCNMG
jgi:hypothetical protein